MHGTASVPTASSWLEFASRALGAEPCLVGDGNVAPSGTQGLFGLVSCACMHRMPRLALAKHGGQKVEGRRQRARPRRLRNMLATDLAKCAPSAGLVAACWALVAESSANALLKLTTRAILTPFCAACGLGLPRWAKHAAFQLSRLNTERVRVGCPVDSLPELLRSCCLIRSHLSCRERCWQRRSSCRYDTRGHTKRIGIDVNRVRPGGRDDSCSSRSSSAKFAPPV